MYDNHLAFFQSFAKLDSLARKNLLLSTLGEPIQYIEDSLVYGDPNFDRIVTAHYDVVLPTSDNANDNTAGLYLATRLLAQENLRTTVIFTEGEERGCIGAQKICDYLNSEGKNPKAIVVLDIVGEGDIVVANMGNTLKVTPTIPMPLNESNIFISNGFPSCCLSGFYKNHDNSFWRNFHTKQDIIDRIDPRTLEMVELKAVSILSQYL